MCKDCGCEANGTNVTKVFKVPGMMCDNCKKTVTGAALGMPGVMSCDVDLKTKDVTISFDSAKSTEEQISKAIDDTGFEVIGITDAPHHHHHGVGSVIKKLFS